ncbi:MAG: GTP-binding protein related to HflX [Myxococcales bacterium]|nr:GTP-binding protein related to HflX [Myxococcales bacterium]
MAFDLGSLNFTADERPTAIVVAVQVQGVTDEEQGSSMDELERLAKTLGLQPIARLVQKRARIAPGVVFGEGKLKEIAKWTGGTGEVPAFQKPGTKRPRDKAVDDDEESEDEDDTVMTTAEAEPEAELEVTAEPEAPASPSGIPGGGQLAKVVLVDHDLTPSQQHNLMLATGVDVLDRTSVIVEIFHRHAKTREARMQVEIARLRYLAPRLRVNSGGGDRVRGGVGGKGAGETKVELDSRRIRDRIAELKNELSQIAGGAKTRRERRSDLPTVALVGYTNAGKSSMMRALTSTDVYIADKLFATLDTTIRRLVPPTNPPILVSDTVGFIKKLPHDLVASFRSTLDEAGDADLLLHLIDASDPAHADQVAVTREVLGEIGADKVETWLLLNKIDRVDEAGRARLAEHYPGAIQLSAKHPADVAKLRERMIERFIGALEDVDLDVPWTAQRVIHMIHERATILSEEHHDDGTRLKVRAPARVIAELRAALTADVL